MTNKSTPAVIRFLFKEIVPGDLRKFEALSNDSETGGGARDIRLGNFLSIEPILRKMFPGTSKEFRTRNGSSTPIEVYTGTFKWEKADGAGVAAKSVLVEPPTTVRPTEGRITRVHEYACFSPSRIPKANAGEKTFLIFVQEEDGAVWPRFFLESSLRSHDWNPKVAGIIRNCIAAKRPSNRTIIGFYDFETQDSYCNGS